MARSYRIEFGGSLYHLTARRNARDGLDRTAYHAAVYLRRRVAGVGMREVGEMFGISGSRVFKIQGRIMDVEVNPGFSTLLREYKVKI